MSSKEAIYANCNVCHTKFDMVHSMFYIHVFLQIIICYMPISRYIVYCILICVWCAKSVVCSSPISFMLYQFQYMLHHNWCVVCWNLRMLDHYSFILYHDFHFCCFCFCLLSLLLNANAIILVVARFVSGSISSIIPSSEELYSLAVACVRTSIQDLKQRGTKTCNGAVFANDLISRWFCSSLTEH